MGQKVNPISNRLGIVRGWDSNWFGGKDFGDNLVEDMKIRKYLNERLAKASVSKIVIERTLLIDDMVDTAGTITKAADLMMNEGAKSVRAIASHAIMSDPATERVNNSAMTEMIFTNSIPYDKECKKVTILSVAHLIADTIRRVHNNESISSQYVFK